MKIEEDYINLRRAPNLIENGEYPSFYQYYKMKCLILYVNMNNLYIPIYL